MTTKEIETKQCIYCWKDFTRPYGMENAKWEARKYCSKSCSTKDRPASSFKYNKQVKPWVTKKGYDV